MTTDELLLDGLEKSTAMMQQVIRESQELRERVKRLEEIAVGQQAELHVLQQAVAAHQRSWESLLAAAQQEKQVH